MTAGHIRDRVGFTVGDPGSPPSAAAGMTFARVVFQTGL